MAFVRWRGGCAQLLASVWEDGRPHQILLKNLPGVRGPVALIASRVPTLAVAGAAVDRALVAGPPGRPAANAPGAHVGRHGSRSAHRGPHHRCPA